MAEPDVIIGIDPGLKGGIAAISGRDILFLEMMPKIKESGNKFVDGNRVGELIKNLIPETTKVYIEKVGARPGQGVTSMFSFGRSYGTVIGAFEAKGFEMNYVTPQKWKNKLFPKKAKDKEASINLSKKLFPEADLKPGRKIVDQDGLAEALLIAFYGGILNWK